jgi:hypothetical protein
MVEQLDVEFMAECDAALRARIGATTANVVDRLDASGRRRLLRAPEITRQILFVATAPSADIDGFVTDAAMVELALSGTGPPPPAARWSALGDVQVLENGALRWWPQLADEAD